MFGTVLAVLVGARLAWWAWSSPTPEQYTYHEDASWRSRYDQRQEAQRTAAAQRLRSQKAASEQERLRRAAAAASAARFTARDYAQAPLRPATYAGETRAAAPRTPWPREYSEIDTDTDSDVSDTPTDAVSVVSHPHGRERRAQRGVSLSELRAAVKHGRKTPARPGRKGQKRWRFEYSGVVYITDETCRHEITSWRV
jgi:regulator of protease activity HflC (stomatin/prohibitin superfamily)